MRWRGTRLLLLLLVLQLVFADRASADWKEERALAIAQVAWHNPCVDQARYAYVDQVEMDGGTPLTVDQHVGARADRGTCTINVGSLYVPAQTSWYTFCALIIHEAGHLADFRDATNATDPLHSSNPASVMYWFGGVYNARCAANGRTFLELHGRLAPRLPRRKELP